MKDDKYMLFRQCMLILSFEDFESFETDVVEDDVRLVLDEYNSSSVTYEIEPGINFFKDFS